ncbi:MAG: acyl-CoA dehydrogenase family protein, partial [Microcystaceae cyanobacterium]
MQLQVDAYSNQEEDLLAVAETYFREMVGPHAASIDREPEALKKALQGMGDRTLLALQVPQCWGG